MSQEVIEQALEAGFTALVLTADLPVVGIRDREVRAGFDTPEGDVPAMVAARARMGDEDPALRLLDAGVEWSYVTELRERYGVPVVVKGLVTAEDAHLACEHGAAGVVVSNHGGRQLDGAVASLDALPEVVEAVDGRAEVYLDGGRAPRHRRRHGPGARRPGGARGTAGDVRARLRRGERACTRCSTSSATRRRTRSLSSAAAHRAR